jgi:hypothetical protein
MVVQHRRSTLPEYIRVHSRNGTKVSSGSCLSIIVQSGLGRYTCYRSAVWHMASGTHEKIGKTDCDPRDASRFIEVSELACQCAPLRFTDTLNFLDSQSACNGRRSTHPMATPRPAQKTATGAAERGQGAAVSSGIADPYDSGLSLPPVVAFCTGAATG